MMHPLRQWHFKPVEIKNSGDTMTITIHYFDSENPETNFQVDSIVEKAISQQDIALEVMRMMEVMFRKRVTRFVSHGK